MTAVRVRTELSVPEAHRLVADLFKPSLRTYWLDFLGSWLCGVVAFALVSRVPELPWGALAFAVSSCALYRAAVFIHELVHHRRRPAFRTFRLAWNALLGVPLLVPVFLYGNHLDHHGRHHYGTEQDAEYVPFARRSPWAMVGFLLSSPFIPALAIVRFGLLAPLSWAVRPLRPYVYLHASSLRIDVEYVWRPPRDAAERRSWVSQEAACCAWTWTVVALVASGTIGLAVVLQAYATLVAIVVLNSLRLLGAHRYLSDESEMDFTEQVVDSLNYPRRRWLAEIWAPVGLRLHGLHHLFPALPYHAFGAAHERLMAGLPADSPYRATVTPGLAYSLRRLWHAARTRREWM